MPKPTTLKLGLLAAAGAVLSISAAAPASAAPASVVFARDVAPFDETVQVLGAAPSSATVRALIVLKLRDSAALTRSNAENKVLTPQQLRDRHLPAQSDYDAVLNFASDAGLRVEKTSPSRMSVVVSGPVAVVSRAFNTHFVRIRSEGRDFVSADTPPSLPAAVAPKVLGIVGLQPNLHAYKQSIVQPAPDVHTDSATAPPFYGQAFISGYGATGLGADGLGATTAIAIDVFPKVTDLQKYFTTTGSTQTTSNYTLINVTGGSIGAPSGEESMDAEVAGAVAPKSKVRVYAASDLSFANLDRVYQAMIDDMNAGVKITQVSISLGACETSLPSSILNTDNNFFAVMTSLGASVFVSTGDSGSVECGRRSGNTVSFFASSPNVTGAGGTRLTLNSSGAETAETAWSCNHRVTSCTGGGVSAYFAKPSYQSGLSYARRSLPDISADADPNTGALVVLNGSNYQIGGTSLSAPILAGLFARANADRIANGKAPLGLVNSRIYSLSATNFRDITSGDNYGYNAAAGYDLVTGIGAPKMNLLIPVLTAQP